MAVCEHCGKRFSKASAEELFDRGWMFDYKNFKIDLCADCAEEAIDEQDTGVYEERCEVCGQMFDPFEEALEFERMSSYSGLELFDLWSGKVGKIVCCNCGIAHQDEEFQ